MNIAYFADPCSVHNCRWINYFAKEHKVVVIASPFNPDLAHLDPEIKIHNILPGPFPYLNIFKRQRTIRRIREVLRNEKIDVMHSMYAFPNTLWAHLGGKQPHIMTTRGSDVLVEYRDFKKKQGSLRHRKANDFLRSLFESAVQSAFAITSTSMAQQEVLKTIIEDHERLHLIRTGVRLDKFEAHLEEAQRTDETLTVFSPRGMKAIYNVDKIVEAFGILHQQQPELDFRLRLASSPRIPEVEDGVKAMIEKWQLNDRVTIMGDLNQPEMAQEYFRSDLVVMLPSSDGVPVTGIETMLAKRPLILPPLPYDQDLFNEETVWKVQSYDSEELAGKIKEVIEAPETVKSGKTSRAAEAARQGADQMQSLQRIEALYQKCLPSD